MTHFICGTIVATAPILYKFALCPIFIGVYKLEIKRTKTLILLRFIHLSISCLRCY